MARLLIAAAGVLTFATVYFVLQFGLRQVPPPIIAQPTATPRAEQSLAMRIGVGQVAVALPVGSAQPLVAGLQPGARLNVLASVPDAATGRPLTAVVARAVTVLQPVTPSEPILVSVEPDDALVLAPLVLGGTGLTYTVWSGGE